MKKIFFASICIKYILFFYKNFAILKIALQDKLFFFYFILIKLNKNKKTEYFDCLANGILFWQNFLFIYF